MNPAKASYPPRAVRYAAYVRTAAADAGAAARQRDQVLAFAERQVTAGAGILVDPVYEDLGASGLDANRPGLARLLADVDAGRVDKVIVADLARLGRSVHLLRELDRRFRARDVVVESIA